MFVKALILGILAGLGGLDIAVVQIHWHRPLVIGTLAGIVLGDVKTGLIAGATLELAFMGLVPLAGAQPPDPVVAGILGTAFSILTKQPPEAAVAFAVPFAIATQSLKTLLFNLCIVLVHKADKYAEEGNFRKVELVNFISMTGWFIVYFTLVFLPIYLGHDSAIKFVNFLPERLMNGLSISGRIMPAVGLATLLKIMLKKELIPFLIAGFVLTVYLQLPVLALALIGVAVALWQEYLLGSREMGQGGSNIGI